MIIQDFQAQQIRLPEERWRHIIDRHPYMMEMREELAETLLDPDTIRKSNSEPDTVRVYYKWFENTVVGRKWVSVVVEFLDDDDAFVRTAFVRRIPAPGEEIWQKENQ